jgi:hypothetical protein
MLFTLAGGVLALALLVAIVGPSLIVADLRETFQAAAGETRGPDAPFVGFLNALWLVAPIAFLVPAIAGRRTLAEFVRDRATQPLLIACAIALPLVWIQTTRAVGQGPHRDWDVTVLLGFPLALAGATLLARLSAPRLRGALMILLPVVTLLGGSWLAVNADEPEAMLRVIALATQPPHGTDSQICGIELYLGQHAMNAGQPALAARHYDRAFELIANPRHALLASESHIMAGERAAAVTMLEKARARGLNPELQVVADRLTRMIAERDSEQALRSTRTP